MSWVSAFADLTPNRMLPQSQRNPYRGVPKHATLQQLQSAGRHHQQTNMWGTGALGHFPGKQRGPGKRRPELMPKGLSYRHSAESHMCKVLPTIHCILPTTFMIYVESGLF